MKGSEEEPPQDPGLGLDQLDLKYLEFLEGFGAAILAVDLQGRFLFLNAQAIELFGYQDDEHELVGQHFAKLLTPEQAGVAQDLFLRGREIRPVVLEAKRRDGRAIRVEVSGAWVRHRGRRIAGLAMLWELSAAPEPATGKRRELSKLDMTILQLLSNGLSNREIAERVYLSKHTIKDRIEKIMRYFGVSRRTELAAKAARQGFV
jgi:PAS domain S-box-containing protein